MSLKYFGSKYSIFPLIEPHILSEINTPKTFVDVFGGGGGAIAGLSPGLFTLGETWNEIYKPSYSFFKCLQNDFETLESTCRKMTAEEGEYILYSLPHSESSSLTLASAFFVYSEASFNGNAGTNWSVGFSKNGSKDLRKLRILRDRFKDVLITCLDFRLTIADKEAFYYADPPYDFDGRGSKDKRSPGSKLPRRQYNHEFKESDHIDLRRLLEGKNAIVSGYESDLYNHLYKDWQKIKITQKEVIWKSSQN